MKKCNKMLLVAIILTLTINSPAYPDTKKLFDVTDHGAKGDGKTLDSPAINTAIEACNKAGGGTVYFPPGTYLSGSIRLKNNVNLNIDMGATILAAPIDSNAYDIPDDNPWYEPVEYQDFGHSFWKNSLIWGKGLDNIAITGMGRIDGTNLSCGPVHKGGGDKMLGLKLCRNVTIKDITIINGGHFAMLLTGCDNMTIYGVKIDTNRDGINLDCCRNVRLAHCTINSPGDDSICFKSSYALGYKRATEDITVTNCMVSGFRRGEATDKKAMLEGFYEGQGISRIKFGTESNGGFKNIVISNCLLRNCFGITLQSNDGGPIENITISNIVMKNVIGGPISIEITNRARGPNTPPPGTVRNINMSNIIAIDSFFGSCINGIKGNPIENVSISNVQAVSHGSGTWEMALKDPNEDLKEPWQGAKWHLPSYGFFCRHIKGLTLNNIRLNTRKKDLRPAFVFDDVQQLELNGIKAKRWPGNKAPILLKNVKDVFVYNSPDLPTIKPLYKNVGLSKNKVSSGEPFTISANALSGKAGLATVIIYMDSVPFATKYLWLDKNTPTLISFSDLKLDTTGRHDIKFEDSKTLSLLIKPK